MTKPANDDPPESTASADENQLRWRSLRLLNLFRFGFGAILLLSYLVQPEPGMLGNLQPRVFVVATSLMVLLAGLAALGLRHRRPSARLQASGLLVADSTLFLMILQSSGGLETGLGNLLFIPVAAAALLLGQRTAITLAALLSLALLFQQVMLNWSALAVQPRFTHAGLLGLLFMLVSLVGARLSRRIRESEALAVKRGLDLRNLSELNDYIIHHLRTGIVVVDHQDRLQLLNGTAAHFLGIREHQRNLPVARVSRRLAKLVERRKNNPFARPPSFTAADDETVVIPRFTELGSPDQPGTLIFLEDSSLQGQRAQEMKLAALGRFTASIAHELRNPLAAISHANQLLSESERLDDEERHFSDIISRHTERVNRIIETVLKLSRREATEPRTLSLDDWLDRYRNELVETGRLDSSELVVDLPETAVTARMDADHLHQVMDNLVENAKRHRDEASDQPIHVRVSHVGERQRPCLEVMNPGPPIPEEDAVHIFEPFYTASPRGTGLGLFVARELCDCNRAKLEYRREDGMNNFRILFSDPERWLT